MNWTNWHCGVASTLVFLGGCTLIVGLDKEYVLDPAALEVVEGGGDEGAGEGNPAMSCMQASDCPEPADKRCGTATCEAGMCGVTRISGVIASQRAGDCKRGVCNYEGIVVEEDDPSDVYDDGAECTFDICSGGAPVNMTILKIVCPLKGEGYCLEGECVQCTSYKECMPNDFCGYYHSCISPTCLNDVKDGTESDEDCGGLCIGCSAGKTCNTGSDCLSGACTAGTCKDPTCDDGVKNNGEAGVDCSGDCVGKLCAAGKDCKVAADCASGVCWAGKCQAPACTDGVKNDEETGVDCGGPCSDC